MCRLDLMESAPHVWEPIQRIQLQHQSTFVIQRFMGHVGYYGRFITNYTALARPLYRLLVKFEWTKECEEFEDNPPPGPYQREFHPKIPAPLSQ